ncbi:MAG: DUF6166 domain-containing protein [Proteobacteria bacterium]|nr:DUF6166 domain-containing protein [Pseudomonadota bacterium]
MKVYSGRREGERVTVTVDGQPLDPCLGLRNFQAGGFEWGYGGSGPSQLALAILAEHAGPQAAPGGYRHFVQTVIAEIETGNWRLTSDEIDQRIAPTTIVPMDLKTLMRKVKGEI